MTNALLLAAVMTAGSPKATTPPAALPAESAAVQARLNAQLAKLAGNKPTQTPALQVAIAQNGRIVYDRAFAYDPSWSFACGDIVSTASDLARFDIALLDGRLLEPGTFAQMQANVVPNPYGMQGLGIFVINWHGLQLVGHHGGVPGNETENETIPARQLAWIVLSNAFDVGTTRESGIVIGSLFPNSVEPAASTAEDRAVTERFREALGSLFQGKIDRSQFSGSPSTRAARSPGFTRRCDRVRR
jgi:CubicO group peptidase (beta-lactamase class C family)